MSWFKQGLCFLPVFLVIWSSSTFIVSYIIAVFRHDVDIIFPYISDTGTTTIYARYKFVEKLSADTTVVNPRLNKTTFVFGMLSCLGMCISVMSHRAHPAGSSVAVCRVRSGVAVLAVLAFFPCVICAFFVTQNALHRDEGDKDYPFHVASAVCEWTVAFSFICFFLTYIDDFKLFTIRVKTECAERL
ncbi:DNA damage-regulated autophagy modulator protein 1 [Liparis tanakae]|uniref:DNA damage-regulated autophagy modulator protein 1 n=1 Tax=Liparis tanakae TaxID=230148 RepID=A0A4Z2HDP4_9TELE|nr:DNA damage-regulated autophagy modulator protein 1 [Liparis tanakae]